jgi:hypothetical protein
MNTNPNKWHIEAAWEKNAHLANRAICLYMAAFKAFNINSKTQKVLGVAGGYCGGDLFVLEQFYAKLSDGQLTSLWIGSEDKIKGEEVDFNTLPSPDLDICQNALEETWEWNSENNWLESEQIRLYPYNENGLKVLKFKSKDFTNSQILVKSSHSIYNPLVNSLCLNLGLKTSPYKLNLKREPAQKIHKTRKENNGTEKSSLTTNSIS